VFENAIEQHGGVVGRHPGRLLLRRLPARLRRARGRRGGAKRVAAGPPRARRL